MRQYYPVVHLLWPKGFFLKERVEEADVVLYQAAHNEETTDFLSAVVFRTLAYSKRAAVSKAIQAGDRLAAAVSLSAGDPVRLERLTWPPSKSRRDVRTELPSLRQAYPPTSYVLALSNGLSKDLTPNARAAVSLISGSGPRLDDGIWNSIYEFAGGLEVEKRHPTLASVAFIAAMSALTDSESCPGTVTCSDCGSRPSHPKRGDINSITSEAAATLGSG